MKGEFVWQNQSKSTPSLVRAVGETRVLARQGWQKSTRPRLRLKRLVVRLPLAKMLNILFIIKTAKSERGIATATTRIHRKDNSMSVKIISYDLGSPEKFEDYEDLIRYIKSLGSWAKPLYSVWFVDTNKTVTKIRDGAKRHIDSNDKIFVAEWDTESGWASYNLPKSVTDWLRSR